ncbi:MAG: two-component system LytT family sensor kinase [Flavobacteriales bacterium]|jgi:two-component system LytT family sensor kinase
MRMYPSKERLAIAKQIGLLMLVVAVGLSFYVLLTQISGLMTINDFESRFLSQLSFLLIKVWLPWFLLSPIVAIVALRFPLLPGNWFRRSLIHFSVLMALSLIHMTFVSYHYHFFETMSPVMATYLPWQHVGHFLFGDSLFLYNTLIYTLLVASFNLKSFYALAQQRGVEAEALSHKLTESKLHALRMQINPHFLFNALNVISVLVMKKEQDKAVNMIERLSSFFRSTLEESKRQWVPLSQELEMTSQYLDIEQLRFGDRLKIFEHYQAAALPVFVPSMILQPLVENAVRHGFGASEKPCELSIRCKIEDGFLVVVVSDDGAGCDFNAKEFNRGIGLSNVEQRLKQLYGPLHQFVLEGTPGEGVSITLKMSILKAEAQSKQG